MSTHLPTTGYESQNKHLIINTWNTVYDIIAIQAKKLGFKERKYDPGLLPNPLVWTNDTPGPK